MKGSRETCNGCLSLASPTYLGMGHTGAPITANDAVPCWLVQLIKVLFYTFGDVLLGSVGAQSMHRRLHRRLKRKRSVEGEEQWKGSPFKSIKNTGYLLHVRWHVRCLDLQFGGWVSVVWGCRCCVIQRQGTGLSTVDTWRESVLEVFVSIQQADFRSIENNIRQFGVRKKWQ